MLDRSNLRGYQLRAAEFILQRPSCALFMDMGLGKTCVGLTALADMGLPRTLVVGPLRVARDVWPDETRQWAHLQHLKVVHIGGHTPKQRLAALKLKADIYTIGRDNLDWLRRQYLERAGEYKWKQIEKWPFDWIFLDESQSYKHQGSTRHKVIWQFRNFFNPRIVEFTGTPVPRSYEDLWGQLRLIDGGERLGRTEGAFQQRWFDPPPYNGYGWTLKPNAAKEIQAKIADVVISMRAEDYLDLPPVIYNPVRVNLPPSALALYKKFERSSLMTLNGKTITAVNAGVLHGKLLQAANGALYTGENREYEIFHNEKVTALLETLEALEPPVLIGYAYKHDLERIGRALTEFGSKRWAVLKSAASMKSFAAGEIDYGVIHPGSGGHGLNDLYISGSENLVWFGLTNDLEMYQQLNARLTGGHRRVGRNVVIHNIIANNTADDDALALLTWKDATQDDLTRSIANMRHK